MSIRFQADADLNLDIVTAVRRREPAIDFATAADAKFEGVSDPEVLERAAKENRILVSHDRRTMLHHFRSAWRDQAHHLPSLTRHVFSR